MIAASTDADRGRRSRFLVRYLLFFWPMVDSSDDVDRVTRFGYHVCIWTFVYTAFTLLPGLVNLDWIAWATFAVVAVLYFVGANAMRQGSALAAAALCLLLATDIPYSYLLDRHFPWQACVTFLAFLIVWRGIALASGFQRSTAAAAPLHPSEVLSPHSRSRFGRTLIDALPPRVWPAYQWAFWAAMVLLLATEAYSSYAYFQLNRHG